MGWPILALILLSLSLVTCYHLPDYELLPPIQKHIPPSDIPSFQRTSVEGLPGALSIANNDLEFGSKSLPLRDAVESSPRIIDKFQTLQDGLEFNSDLFNKRTLLRNAIERRPPPPLGNNIVSHESIWLEQLSPPVIRKNQGPPKVICRYNPETVYRNEPFSLNPQNIPSRKCTHIIYSAATFDPQSWVIISRNSEHDELKGGYRKVTNLRKKNPSLRVLISINSLGHGKHYGELITNAKHIKEFIKSVVDFLEEHQFDGIELNWKNPNIRQLKIVLRSLYPALYSRAYTLAVVLRPEDMIDAELNNLADILLLQPWKISSQIASHPAPLESTSLFVKRWINAGVSSEKMVLGIPLFGKSYTLKCRNSTHAGSPAIGPGLGGPYTRRIGFLAYYEICEKMDNLWFTGRDEQGPFLQRGDQWIGFDDPISIKLKAAYIKTMNLGGVLLSSIDLDDFVGICGTPWPMLDAVTSSLGIYDVPLEKCETEGIFNDPENCAGYLICDKGKLYRGLCDKKLFFNSLEKRCVKADLGVCHPGYVGRFTEESNYLVALREKQQSQQLRVQQNGPRVVCYVTSWALYRKGDGKFVPEYLDNRLCTDVIYAFAGLNPDTLTIQAFDPWADMDNGLYQRITSMKGSRILLAIGGWTDSSGDKYSRLVSSPSARRKFIASTINFLHSNNFDGLSFEWNYPKCWQSDCSKGPDSDKPNYTKLIQELKREFDKAVPQLTLAVALSGYKEVIDRAYEIGELSDAVDFISVMTYDYHGAWESKTGHLAPLYSKPDDINPYYNVNWTANYLMSLGAEKSKLIIGIPFYGQAYRLAQPERWKLGDPAAGPGKPGEYTGQPGMLGYYEICERIKHKNWKTESEPSAHFKDQFVGYDDPNSVAEKGFWLLQNGFGGAMAWTVDLDDFMNICCLEPFPLLRSLNRALGRFLDPTPFGQNCERPSDPITPSPPTLTTHKDANDGLPRPTRPVTFSTTKATTWPTWTEKPNKKPTSTSTTWPTWTWKPTSTTTTTTTTIRAPTEWVTTTKKPIETTYPETSSPASGMPCDFGEYVPDPINCRNFFRCVLGQLKQEHCPSGLHWDSVNNRCDWPGLVKCQLASVPESSEKPWSTPTTSTSKKSTTTTMRTTITTRPTRLTTSTTSTLSPVRPIETPSKPCNHGEYNAYSESCTHFLICVNGDKIIQQCGPGLSWNDEKKMCDWAFMNPCKDKSKQNSPLMMKEMETSKPCIPGSLTGVPGDCESYHACLWGRHEKFSCAPGLHFNKETHICDWPYRANCNEILEEATIQPVFAITTNHPIRPTKRPTTMSITTISTTQMPWNQWTEPPKPLPPAKVDPSKKSPLSGYFKIVCYFTNWAWYRRGHGKYLPEHIDHTLCTHIVYGFAVLDYSELTIRAHDSWADFDNRFYDRVVAYKKRGVKVSLALGGWNDSAGDKYSRLANSPSSRRKFIDHVIKFIEKYGFEGLDLDWEYPVCWQVDCRKGPASDKEGFASLLSELSAEFKPRGLLLSSAVSPSKTVVDKGYDVPALSKYLDWIAVMAYDYHGQWDKKTGHVAPLYYHEDDEFYFFNANYSINYWISKGAPPRKIVMGMPLYGQAFSINDPGAGTGLNAPASAGLAGEFTRSAGFLAYYEICDRIKNKGWKVYQDPQRRMGPYAYKGNQWVSFDDSNMIRQKAQFVRDMGLGGGMVWALDLDDFRGRCDDGEHPLMNTLQVVLSEPPTKHDRPIKPPVVGHELEWRPFTPPPKSTTSQTNKDTNIDAFKVVCYFTNWAWYRQEGGKFLPENIDRDLCTHIIYGFAVLDGSSLTIKPHDSWADIDNKFYERVVAYKAKGIKVLIAIGGWNDSAGDKYSRLVNSPASRSRFITHVIQFIEKYGFDGLDLDWEYPVCWQVDCNQGPASDKEAFALFVKELSSTLKPKGLLLSSAVSPSKRVINHGYDVPALAKYLDWISVMTYDFHGQWDKKTGHVAPLYVRPDDWEPTFNANFSVRYWLELGVPAKKLIMGAPLYGQSFSLAERNNRGLNAPTYGGGEAGESTRARGFLAYYEICERTLKKEWAVVQDPERRIGPYAYKGDQWVSFDDAKQIKLKAELIKELGLGGGMVWALDLDDFENRCKCEPSPLLRTMNRVLRNYPDGPLCSVTGSGTAEMEPIPTPISQPSSSSSSSSSSTTMASTYLTPDPDDSIEVIAGQIPSTQLPIGECASEQFMAHDDDCRKYLICNFGQVSEMTCPSGLHWNKDHCDWPENSECKNMKIDQNEETNTIPGKFAESKQSLLSSTLETREMINEENKKVICYFTNWSWYRSSKGKFLPEYIDSNLCTHIIYGFSILDNDKLIVKIQDPLTDIDNDFYGRIRAFKSKGIKVLIALGGWYDSAGDKYSILVNNPSARSRFINDTVKFIDKHGFDGLDIDWQYPVCWQVECERGSASDKEAFALFVKELSFVFKPKGLLLSAAVSASKRVIDNGYNVPILSKYLDWISVMTYDFHGNWEAKTGHLAPLYYYPGDEYDYFNANFSMHYWIEKGSDPSKLIMGFPMYGQSFTLTNSEYTKLQSPAVSPGLAGSYTQQTGILAFYEICQKVKDEKWYVNKDPENRIGPYATRGDQWVSYDEVTNVLKKAAFIRELNLAGGMIWALDFDDFNGNCGCGKYPLLTALNNGLTGSAYGKDCT